MLNIRKKAIEGLEKGDTFSVSRTFTEKDVIQFADISRDYNPVHCDERFAKVKNFNGRICHGLLIASQVTEIGGQMGWLASGMTFKYRKPVYFGDTIRCDLTVTELDEKGFIKGEAVFRNEHDITVLEAVVTGIVAGDQEKQVMKGMLAEGDPTNKISP
jgi:3-hydroxybutyryl-CoA dehydratase